jgi:phage terminase large subunit
MVVKKKMAKYKILKPYRPAVNTTARYIIIMGGRGAGRSYFVSQLLTMWIQTREFFRGAIMRFVLGDIRNSIFQEIKDRIEDYEMGGFEVKENLTILWGNNFIRGIGFRKSTSDQKSKLKSLAQFSAVHIEEADETVEEDFMQLDDSLRTIKQDIKIILTLNCPDKNHWIIKRWFNLVPSGVEGFYTPVLKDSEKHNTLFIHTTYKDNAVNLNQTTKDNYKRYQTTKPDYYWNMIMGLVSEGRRGRIFKNWKPITEKEYNELPYTPYYGLDFGFSNHPTALVEIKEHNNNIWTKELIYETGLTNQRIAKKLEELGVSRLQPIYADSAEPKSIEELRVLDWNVQPAVKGPDSINVGVDMLLEKEVSYTENSTNIALENQEYRWALDRNKEPTNDPVDDFNHCFTGNSLVHTIFGKRKIKDLVGQTGFLYSRDGSIQRFSNVRPTRSNTETLKIEFTDGNILEVTPDHLLLRPDGIWVEAGLLHSGDMIQSVIYENTNIQWKDLYTLQWGKILQSWNKKIAQGCLGTLQWFNPKRNASRPHRWGQGKQFNIKSPAIRPETTRKETYDTRKVCENEVLDCKNKTVNKEMALIKRGQGVAQIEWNKNLRGKKTFSERMCSLPFTIFNNTVCKISPFLSPKLQNESKDKTIKGITRGFRYIVYNMDVENTECLLVNGVIAHNCMDALRYGVYSNSKQVFVI